MAMNTKGKKTSLNEEALIYEKRDEKEPEKLKWKKMTRQEKKVHFMTYYFRIVMIILAVIVVGGYLFYQDVINRSEIVYRCDILNERALDGPVTEFGDKFTEFLALDPDKNTSSFKMYYTDHELATEVGTSSATALSQVSSEIYAAMLDSMIAEERYYTTYLDNGFFVDLTTLLSDEELAVIQQYLYIPEGEGNPEQKPYGVYLDQSSVYKEMFREGGGVVEKPIFGILFNSEHKDNSLRLLYYLFPELQQLQQG